MNVVQTMKHRLTAIELPPWLDQLFFVLRVFYKDMNRANIFNHASAMAYMTLGSIVPSLAATFAIISSFGNLTDPSASWFTRFRNFILETLTPNTGQRMVEYLETFVANLDIAAIGTTGFLSLLVILLLLLRNIELAFNKIWEVADDRSLFRRFVFFWTFITLGAFVLSLTVGIITSFNLTQLVPFIGEKSGSSGFWSALGTFFASFLFFAFLYKIGPNCTVNFRATIIGGLSAAIMFRVASRLYALYAVNNKTYETIYGALAALPVFLLWLYICWLITLLGAVITWRTQQGFDAPKAAAADAIGSATDPLDQDKCLQLRALMPLICILAVYYRFDQARGEGITGSDLAKNLDLPPKWVSAALRSGIAMGYIALRHPASFDADNEAINILELEAMPTYPPSSVDLHDIAKRLTQQALTWLDARESKSTFDLKHILSQLIQKLSPGELHVSLEVILTEMRQIPS